MTQKKRILILIGLVGAILLVLVLERGVFIKLDRKLQTAKTVTYSTDKPSEKKPGHDYKWEGGSQDPKKIKIPKIGVDAYIQNVGVDQNGEVAVPNNNFIVGWFINSVRPGQKGLSVIDGHVGGSRNIGIFKGLEKLDKGDEYSVEFGDGTVKSFRVIRKQSVPVNEAVSVIFSQEPKVTRQLNLVTCSGVFNDKNQSYDERLTVMSEQI